MKIFKAIIIDDEIKASENLEFLLQSYCKQIEVIAIYNHPLVALEGVKTLQPDILFLDIEMPQIDGFQLLELLQKNATTKVIFTTAYKDYAINAIKKQASDYLLKPIDIKELIVATERIISEPITTKRKEQHAPQLLKIASVNGFDILNIKDIAYLKSTNNTTEIFYERDTLQKSIVATKPIKYFEEILECNGFFRVHDSYLVNLIKIKNYLKGEGGTIIMQDGMEIDVSRRKKQNFLSLFLG